LIRKKYCLPWTRIKMWKVFIRRVLG